MITIVLKALLFVLRPLHKVDRRLCFLEKLIQLNLGPRQYESVQASCRASNRLLGSHYYWKIQQITQSVAFRHLNKTALNRLINAADASSYARALLEISRRPEGCVVAVPHYGAFVFSIIALVEQLRSKREVFVFYDPPDVHSTNAVFDALYSRLGEDPSSGVAILHNNRAGIVTALKRLSAGAIVFIMPDVFKKLEDTYRIPFCGRSRNVMLGTAVIARRSRARILPLISYPSDRGFCFTTRFGEMIEPPPLESVNDKAGDSQTLYEDYRVTLRLFQQFEGLMREHLIYWQYCKTHFLGDPAPTALSPKELKRVTELLLQDPRLRVDVSDPVTLVSGEVG